MRTRPGTGVEEYDDLPGPTLLKRTLGLQNLHHSQFIGPNDILDVYNPAVLNELPQRDSKANKSAINVRFVHPSTAFRIVPDTGSTEAIVDEIEDTVQGHGSELVNLYFRIIHPSFPIIHRAVFIEKYQRSYREFSPPLLAAIYLLSSGYWTFSESLAGVQKPDLSRLQKMALVSLQHALKMPKLSTIQAGLLLFQYLATGPGPALESEHQDLSLRLVVAAQGLGLHLDAENWDIPRWEVGLRRRIGWALYFQDKWCALVGSRLSLISDEQWDVDPPTAADFPVSGEGCNHSLSKTLAHI